MYMTMMAILYVDGKVLQSIILDPVIVRLYYTHFNEKTNTTKTALLTDDGN